MSTTNPGSLPGGYESMLAAALEYAERFGWNVLPLHTPVMGSGTPRCSCRQGAACPTKLIGKHPRWLKDTLKHGHKSATTDLAIIRDWWKRWPDANIGIATGADSGFFVIDRDPRNGANDTWPELESKHGKFPSTVQVLTGGGGVHDYLLHPGPGRYLRCKDGVLGAGIDIKADGGYVVAPPSLHRSGKRYAWELSHFPGEIAVAAPPDWVFREIEQQRGSIDPSTTLQLCGSTALSHSDALPLCGSTALSHSDALPLCGSISSDIPAAVAELIQRTLPTKPGTRRAQVMRLARGLKFDLEHASTSLVTIEMWVREWHRLAWPKTSRTTPGEETWFDFMEFWTLSGFRSTATSRKRLTLRRRHRRFRLGQRRSVILKCRC